MKPTCNKSYNLLKKEIDSYQKLINFAFSKKKKDECKKYQHNFLLKIDDILKNHITCTCYICSSISEISRIVIPYNNTYGKRDIYPEKVTDIYNTVTCIFYRLHPKEN